MSADLFAIALGRGTFVYVVRFQPIWIRAIAKVGQSNSETTELEGTPQGGPSTASTEPPTIRGGRAGGDR